MHSCTKILVFSKVCCLFSLHACLGAMKVQQSQMKAELNKLVDVFTMPLQGLLKGNLLPLWMLRLTLIYKDGFRKGREFNPNILVINCMKNRTFVI